MPGALEISTDPAVALAGAHPAARERRDSLGVRLEQPLGTLLHPWQQVRVPHQVGDAQLRESGLARAEELTRRWVGGGERYGRVG